MKPERELAEKFLGVIPNDEAHERQIEYLAHLVKEHCTEQLQQHNVSGLVCRCGNPISRTECDDCLDSRIISELEH